MKKMLLLTICGIVSSIVVYSQQSTSGPTRPENVSKGIVKTKSKGEVVIEGVPCYAWYRGCGPTSLGMVVGYYDLNGYSDLIDGEADLQYSHVCDAIASNDHYNSYSLPKDYKPNMVKDKSETGGAHTSNSIADFLKTSRSYNNNYWGWSWSSHMGPAFKDYVSYKNDEYYRSSSNVWSANEYSWIGFKKEIDNKRPVVLIVDTDGDGYTDHFVVGIGYDASTKQYAVYDTWDEDIHWFAWREMAENNDWGIYGYTTFDISFKVKAKSDPVEGGSVIGTGNFHYEDSVILKTQAAEGYKFKAWMEDEEIVSTDSDYKFTAGANRNLIASFSLKTDIESDIADIKPQIYPNPAKDKIYIKVDRIFDIKIIDITGRIVYEQVKMKEKEIDLSGLKKGIYILVFSDKNSKSTQKLIIK